MNSEFNQLKRYASFISEMLYAKDEMKSRLEMLENGSERFENCIKESTDLFDELLDTVPVKQRKSILNSMTDYRVTFVPASAPNSKKIVMNKDDAKALVDLAQEQCKFCVKTPEEAEECPIFTTVLGVVPPDTYNTLICPYSQAKWADE